MKPGNGWGFPCGFPPSAIQRLGCPEETEPTDQQLLPFFSQSQAVSAFSETNEATHTACIFTPEALWADPGFFLGDCYLHPSSTHLEPSARILAALCSLLFSRFISFAVSPGEGGGGQGQKPGLSPFNLPLRRSSKTTPFQNDPFTVQRTLT